jgi:hypothetical protein
MAPLADLPELVGFFSYSRDDDEGSHGALSALRERIQSELRGQLGRSMKTFRLWQDKEAIAPGKLWEDEIKTGVGQAAFFIPIITPTVVRSPNCRFELEAFLTREAELGRNDLVFPILYIKVPELEDAARQKSDPILSIVARRQYLDWRDFRHRDVNSPDIMEAIERFCAKICEALNRSARSPEERTVRSAVVAERALGMETETGYRGEQPQPRGTATPTQLSKHGLMIGSVGAAIAAIAAIGIWLTVAPSRSLTESSAVPAPSSTPLTIPPPLLAAPTLSEQPTQSPPAAPPPPAGGFIIPDSDRRYLTRDELQKLSPGDLRIARNEIFARRGRYFSDSQLRVYFAQFSWYRPYSYDVPLNAIENANVALIQSMEH